MLRLYTDESPGLKVDPMVILFLSLGFIFSVVALHRKFPDPRAEAAIEPDLADTICSHCKDYQEILIDAFQPSLERDF